jgi:hypothetical protein
MSENDRLDQEVEELQERSEKLENEISDVREDWERKKADDRVPGAVGEAVGDAGEESGDPPPEAEGPG